MCKTKLQRCVKIQAQLLSSNLINFHKILPCVKERGCLWFEVEDTKDFVIQMEFYKRSRAICTPIPQRKLFSCHTRSSVLLIRNSSLAPIAPL
ncbi:hypothetical protein CEXT_207451 [Caerostris extrusa]|uniref:Uncharacterized protein n=1 Tax=Caerostris extrusa TaxID=172846 RepID=A0AAV4VP41_CAEEX|nr:hypothetical protein CEXT_207451 [Caerostris extrusa]